MVLLHQKQDTVRAHSKKSRKKDDFYLTIPNKCSIFAVPVRGVKSISIYKESPSLPNTQPDRDFSDREDAIRRNSEQHGEGT